MSGRNLTPSALSHSRPKARASVKGCGRVSSARREQGEGKIRVVCSRVYERTISPARTQSRSHATVVGRALGLLLIFARARGSALRVPVSGPFCGGKFSLTVHWQSGIVLATPKKISPILVQGFRSVTVCHRGAHVKVSVIEWGV